MEDKSIRRGEHPTNSAENRAALSKHPSHVIEPRLNTQAGSNVCISFRIVLRSDAAEAPPTTLRPRARGMLIDWSENVGTPSCRVRLLHILDNSDTTTTTVTKEAWRFTPIGSAADRIDAHQ